MSEAFAAMLRLAGAAPAPDRPALYAFVCSYAAHLCLDAGAHPWILYWTGDVSRGIRLGRWGPGDAAARDLLGVARCHARRQAPAAGLPLASEPAAALDGASATLAV